MIEELAEQREPGAERCGDAAIGRDVGDRQGAGGWIDVERASDGIEIGHERDAVDIDGERICTKSPVVGSCTTSELIPFAAMKACTAAGLLAV